MKQCNLLNLVLLFFSIFSHSLYANNLSLEIKVKNSGEIDVTGKITTESGLSDSSMLFLVPLPFSLRPNVEFESAQDVKVAIASSGNSYTFLSLIAEVTDNPISFGIKNGISFSETAEGKAKLEMFPSYKYITKVEKNLITQSVTIKNLDITIQLPKRYNSTEVGFRPLTVKTIDDQRFKFPKVLVPDLSGDDYWFVFPNPATADLKWAKIVISFLFGLFTIAIHVPALKKANLTWQVSVLLLSSVILIISIYFSYTLAKKLDFGLFIAASLPHVIFGLIATLWLFLTKKYRVLISGTVHKNSVPIQFAAVTLEQKKGTGFVEIKFMSQLNENGRFSFATLLFKNTKEIYRIKTQMAGSQDVITNEFELSRSQTYEVPSIALTPIA